MKIIQTEIPDLIVIEPSVFADSRGYFFESYNEARFKEFGLNARFVQDNESRSSKGTIRGLHYQLNPVAQTKLVRVIEGVVYDVAIDLRKGSPTFGKWHGEILTADNKKQFYIPQGFAHGFSVLSETAVFAYKCDNFYSKENERGIRYNDPTLNIDWKIAEDLAIVSDKDLQQPLLADAEYNFEF